MSLDFPSNPVDGQTHVQNGQVWTWRATPGVWSVGDSTGQITEIMEDDSGVSYFVIGDTLIQWGTGGGNASGSAVVFPVAYPVGEVPTVNAGTGRADGMAAAYSVTNTGFTGLVTRHDGVATSSDYVYISVGEAPDDLKKPKSVLGGGAGGDVPIVDEGAGYQIVGGKMIAWGRAQTANTTGEITVTFPKAFAAPPAVSNTAELITSGVTAQTGTPTETNVLLQTRHDSGAIADNIWCNWLAVGDCLPEDAMPTIVIGNGVTEFHDPANVGSWRLIGKTLECWGTATSSASASVTVAFPRTFARAPTVTFSQIHDGTSARLAMINEGNGGVTATDFSLDNRNPANNVRVAALARWHAIGEVGP